MYSVHTVVSRDGDGNEKREGSRETWADVVAVRGGGGKGGCRMKKGVL